MKRCWHLFQVYHKQLRQPRAASNTSWLKNVRLRSIKLSAWKIFDRGGGLVDLQQKMIKTLLFPLVYKQRLVKKPSKQPASEKKPCHNISKLQRLLLKCEIYGCSIFIGFLFVLFIHEARFVVETKGDSDSIGILFFVSICIRFGRARSHK